VTGRPPRIYNTLTRTKEDLAPITTGTIRMYVCGITVYDLCHVGHARSAIVFDVIRRYLTFKGYRVMFVKNFTDVDDRIIRRAQDEGVTASEIAERYIAEFYRDMDAIGVLRGDVEPKATDHVADMVALIERLLVGGFAYVVDGDVFFEIQRFPPYGRLSGKNLEELLAGARVEVDERKRDPRDFALWKAAKPGEPAWPSPWGQGRPGWHIECSAMSMRYLGESFDVHGGGEDLVFPHHECELAQSEAATAKPFARYWIHNAFVNLGAEKMSKSLGNVLHIREIVKRHDPDALRLWLLGAHYRSPIDFSEDRLREAGRALETLWGPLEQARKYRGSETFEEAASRPLPDRFAAYRDGFVEAMDDDFNTSQALGVLFNFAHALNRDSLSIQDLIRGAGELSSLARVLGLNEPKPKIRDLPRALSDRITALIQERTEARERRDFRRADEIRTQLEQLGVLVRDTPAGPEWEWKGSRPR
jgi:cysteinyl-tRNA synthetase